MLRRAMSIWSRFWQPLPLRSSLAEPDGGDRRGLQRFPRNQEVFCRPMAAVGSVSRWPAMIQDVSAGGIGLRINYPVAPETLLAVEFPRPIPRLPASLPVRVIRVIPQVGGCWEVGCAFASDLTHAQLHALLEALR